MNIYISFLVLILALAQPASASNFATKVNDATFKLFHPDSTATCFLLREAKPDAPYYLVTAAHVLGRIKDETATLVLRTPNENGGYERMDHSIRIRMGNEPLWVQHKTHDVAVLKLSGPMPSPVPALQLEWLADRERLKKSEVRICSSLFVLTFPTRFEANAAGFPVARQGIFSSPPLLPSHDHPTFLADFTTFAGDSGGPVFIADKDEKTPLVVGIVLGQNFHNEKFRSEYQDHHLRHPLGLGIILHSRYIRETFDIAAASK